MEHESWPRILLAINGNNNRSVALTSVVMKSFKYLAVLPQIPNQSTPGPADVRLQTKQVCRQCSKQHLDSPGTYARIRFGGKAREQNNAPPLPTSKKK